MQHRSSILLIEDSRGECDLFRLALAAARPDVALYAEHDAEAALHFLRHQPSVPSLTLLDWQLQSQRGDRFLKHLRSDVRFAGIPVVVFTTSDEASDLAAAYAHGANGYVVKPATFDELVCCVTNLCDYWLRWNRSIVAAGAQC
jgi:DNA-binding response OmpR family regulator